VINGERNVVPATVTARVVITSKDRPRDILVNLPLTFTNNSPHDLAGSFIDGPHFRFKVISLLEKGLPLGMIHFQHFGFSELLAMFIREDHQELPAIARVNGAGQLDRVSDIMQIQIG
jgi:hypothetical protein